MSIENPLVSVCMITYNHEAFIKKAIEGVLMQQTDFNIDFVISNDCSTDNTHAIIEELIATNTNHNIVFSYYNQERNLGMMPNFVFALEKCQGKYIALCEGDDYWANPLKLKMQIDFLEENYGYSISAHNTYENHENNENSNRVIPNFKKDRDLDIHDYILKNHTATCSLVFESRFLKQVPSWFKNLPFGDLGLVLIVLERSKKKVRVSKEQMSVYRVHDKGIHGSLRKNNITSVEAIKLHLRFIKIMQRHFLTNSTYNKTIFLKKAYSYIAISRYLKLENKLLSFFVAKISYYYYRLLSKI